MSDPKPDPKPIPWTIVNAENVSFGTLADDGSIQVGPVKHTLEPKFTGDPVETEFHSIATRVLPLSATISFTLSDEAHQRLLEILMPPWGYVQWSAKDGTPAGRAVIFTEADAEALLRGEQIIVNWQKYDAGEWHSIERGPLQMHMLNRTTKHFSKNGRIDTFRDNRKNRPNPRK